MTLSGGNGVSLRGVVNGLVNARAKITDILRDGVETFRVSSRRIVIRLVNARASITDSVRDES